MLKRVTFIMAVLICALLSAGCSIRLDDPVQTKTVPEGAIGFCAGSVLLLDDAVPTRSTGLKTTFALADKFFVYGTKTLSNTRYNVFNGQQVNLQSLGSDASDPEDDVWEYSPVRFWDGNATQYDFLAISGPATNATISSNPAYSGHVSASVTYDATGTPYDLMAAGYRRDDGTTSPVNFEFNHVLSAVRVTIINDSPLIDVTVNSYGFRNICTRATGLIEQRNNGLAPMGTGSWDNLAYNGTVVLGKSDTLVLDKDETYSLAADQWDLMIPQDLSPHGDYVPQLMLDYEYDQVNPYTDMLEHYHPVFPIRLEEINVKGSNDVIDEWLPGIKYNYEIHIRLGGGINVTVSVTDWTEVLAETPGLTIL